MADLSRLSEEVHQVAAAIGDLLHLTRVPRPLCTTVVHDSLVEVQVHTSRALFELDGLAGQLAQQQATSRAG